MRLENAVAADVLERILSAYGFTMQKELSDKLGIAKSNVASWLQRGQVPGNVLVQCALDTGADIQWLVTGKFANANNFEQSIFLGLRPSLKSGKELIEKMLTNGGRIILQRVMSAYGFSTQKELSEYLGISTGTISTWVRRSYFPGDVVIACALDTGVSLQWLATGDQDESVALEVRKTSKTNKVLDLSNFALSSGTLKSDGIFSFDVSLLPENISFDNIKSIKYLDKIMLIDSEIKEFTNGYWLLDIDGYLDVYTVTRIPKGCIRVTNDTASFDCPLNDVVKKGKVIAEFYSYR